MILYFVCESCFVFLVSSSYDRMNRAALYVEEAVESVGLICLFRHRTHTKVQVLDWVETETAVGMFLPAVQSDASSTCSPFFFVEHHCNTFAVLRVIYSSHLFVLYGHVVLIYLGTCRPIPISPVTAKGATNTSGVVFHRSQRFKLLLRRTSLAFSLFVFGGEQQ